MMSVFRGSIDTIASVSLVSPLKINVLVFQTRPYSTNGCCFGSGRAVEGPILFWSIERDGR